MRFDTHNFPPPPLIVMSLKGPLSDEAHVCEPKDLDLSLFPRLDLNKLFKMLKTSLAVVFWVKLNTVTKA